MLPDPPHADRIRTPTLFLCGADDFNVPLSATEQMYQALKSLDASLMAEADKLDQLINLVGELVIAGAWFTC